MKGQNQDQVKLTLKEQSRFEELFGQFAKSDAHSMKFSEFMMFCLDRNLLSCQVTLSEILDLFDDSESN